MLLRTGTWEGWPNLKDQDKVDQKMTLTILLGQNQEEEALGHNC